MSDWTAGYVSEIGYTYGYYSELNPMRVALPLLINNMIYPKIEDACELGFGQGMSINIHAAATAVSWYGTDFNPSHMGFAQELSTASGANIHLYDEAFDEFCNRKDLPDFDFIGLHGIWSWISDENRAVIVDFVRRKLKVGGVLYISYNTQPGWASMVPMRELLLEYGDLLAAKGMGIVSRIDAALDFAEKLFAVNPLFAAANPKVKEKIELMKRQNRHYLAHEYFNRDWHPMSFLKLKEYLASAKLSFAASAHYIDHVEIINLTDEQLALLNGIPDGVFRQFVKDFICNTQFRRDYWVKGVRQGCILDRNEKIRQLKVILGKLPEEVDFKVIGVRGEAKLSEQIYKPILEVLSDLKPHSIGQIEQGVSKYNITIAQIIQATLILIGKGDLFPVQDEQIIGRVKKQCDRLNLHLMNKSRSSNDFSFLASPVTGGGVALNRFHQLFLLARSQGKKSPEEWAEFTYEHLSMLGQKLNKDGKVLETKEENISELQKIAEEFGKKQLPVLKGLQIA